MMRPLVIPYMFVKLIIMRPFILIGTVYSITVRGAVIYYEGLVHVFERLDAYIYVCTHRRRR